MRSDFTMEAGEKAENSLLNKLSQTPTRDKGDSKLSPRALNGHSDSYNSLERMGARNLDRPATATPIIASPGESIDKTPTQDSQEAERKQQQLRAYLAWVNSQLKKKAGTRPIEDMRNDMRDGVVLVQLIEIVAGEKLTGVHHVPSNLTEMRENVERVLQFMSTNRIRMHHTTAKDIVDGHLRSIMRLILAFAAHFKPGSVKQSAQQLYRSPYKTPNITGIAQGAAAAIADARRDASKAGSRVRRNREHSRREKSRKHRHDTSSDQLSDSDQSFTLDRSRTNAGLYVRDEVEGASAYSSPSSSSQNSPQTSIIYTPNRLDSINILRSKSSDYLTSRDSSVVIEDNSNVVERIQYEELHHEYDRLSMTMKETKSELILLQDLLLSGQPPDGEEQSYSFMGETDLDQLVILKSRLQQATEVSNELKEELSKSKIECMRLQGTKAGLQQRLSEQENVMLQMKAELLRNSMQHGSRESERSELQKKIQEKEKTIADLKKEVSFKDKKVEKLLADLQQIKQQKENSIKCLKSEIQMLHDRLKVVGQTEATLSAKIASQDKLMAKLGGKILKTQVDNGGNGSNSSPGDGPEDLQLMRDSLLSLRSYFKGTDPQQHTLDTLEQTIDSLMDRLHTTLTADEQNTFDVVPRRLNFDNTVDTSRRTPSQGFLGNQHDVSSMNGQAVTKVLYFTDRTVTPFKCTIAKRIGEITLKDFKEMCDRPGNFRYHFKALDPEFGTVKEEVHGDDEVIPGWEGKVVAWIEEASTQS